MRQQRKKRTAESLPSRIKFYADEDVEIHLVNFLRQRHKLNITTAAELGFTGRDDRFHFQEAKRQGRFLLTCDKDFLNHSQFPFNQMVGVVILDIPSERPGVGWTIVALEREIVPSGKHIHGTKIVIHAGNFDIYWRDETGKVQKQNLRF